MACYEKVALLEASTSATQFYSYAVGKLQIARSTAVTGAYEDAKRISEDARQQCEATFRELENHRADHGC
jgi:hypothetical protein